MRAERLVARGARRQVYAVLDQVGARRTAVAATEPAGHAVRVAADGSKRERDRLLKQLRAICFAMPEVTERPSHGAPTWFVRDKKVFATVWDPGAHRGCPFFNLWCAAAGGLQEALTAARPDRFFRPPYVGGRGWLGVRLDGTVDWGEVEELCQDSYRLIAPPKLVVELDHALGGLS